MRVCAGLLNSLCQNLILIDHVPFIVAVLVIMLISMCRIYENGGKTLKYFAVDGQ